ncbi:MAG: small subunit ribosomal protein [Thermotogaceae bacterium]|nr:small subunit ribosomal protein [Thermotogaceae bacterium]
MRIYELMFITDPRLPEEQREEGVEKVKKVIEERVNGKVEKVDRWGIRKLAYTLPKSKLEEGDYTVILFRADGSELEPLENLFQVSPEFVRKQIVRREDIEKEERKKVIQNRLNGTVEIEEPAEEVVEEVVQEDSEPEFDVEEKGE